MKPKIAAAVGTAAAASGKGAEGKALAQRIEAAMAQAVHDAMAEGISMEDTETIKARMMAARQAVLDTSTE